MEFSQRLIAARKDKGISQEALAEELGVSRQAVSKWETGESKPDLGNLIGLCRVLGVNIEYLCLGTLQPSAQASTKSSLPRWAKILLAAVCCFALLVSGAWIGAAWAYGNVSSPDTEAGLSLDITSIQVINATACYDAEKDCYEITVTPSLVYDEVELLIRAEPDDGGSERSFRCTLEDGVYIGHFYNAETNVEYTLTAVFSCDGVKKQVAVMKFQAHASGGFGYEQLWDA